MNEELKIPATMEKTSGELGGSSGEVSVKNSARDNSARDDFYQKLVKLNESSGLSFVFNFRETVLDLHCLYKEVIQRGGFYQVTKFGKWNDVASALKLKRLVNITASQLQNAYETLLLQYELMYSYKTTKEENTWPEKSSLGVSPSSSTAKWKHCGNSFPPMARSGDVDGMSDKWKHTDDSCQLVSGQNTMYTNSTKIIVSSNTNVEEFIEIPDAPVKPRTGYQIFLRVETQRLKMIHGESSGSHNLREMAVQTWRSLTEEGKQPYIEASKMDKERYEKEMTSYEVLLRSQNARTQSLVSNWTPSMLSFSKPAETDDVYHVSLEADYDDHISPDESLVEMAIDVMKSDESNHPMLQIDWDYTSLHSPSQMNNEGTFYAGGA